jgi:hypothetical protein
MGIAIIRVDRPKSGRPRKARRSLKNRPNISGCASAARTKYVVIVRPTK